MSFEHKYIELFSELDLRAKVATLKIDFDIAVAKSITAGGGDQQCWSLLFSGKQRDGSTPAIILRISSTFSNRFTLLFNFNMVATWRHFFIVFFLFNFRSRHFFIVVFLFNFRFAYRSSRLSLPFPILIGWSK